MYCDVCGHPLNENGFCPICGWALSTTDAGSVSQELSNPPTTPPETGHPQPNNYNQPNMANMPQAANFNQPNPANMPQMNNYSQPKQANMPQMNNYSQPNPVNTPQAANYSQPNPVNTPQMGNFNQPNPANMPQMGNFNQPKPANMPPNGNYNQQNQYAGYYNQANQTQPPKKKSKWPLIVGIIIAVIAIIVITVIIIKENKVKDYTQNKTTEETTERTTEATTTEEPTTATPVIDAEEGSKTIMMYIVGSDLESEYDAASDDIYEILSAEYDSDKINVILYTGGCYDWDNRDIPDDANSIILVDDGDLVVLDEGEEKNMGDADTLADFLEYGYTNYPAEQYSVILWNHGGGAFFGYGYDETTDDSLTLEELDKAFAASPFNENNKLEWIGFDACLMATIETAHTLSPYANYMIASQETEPGWGWDYTFLEEIGNLESGADIGTKIVDYYISYSEDEFEAAPYIYSNITLSVMDLNETENVETALNELFEKANDDLSQDTYSQYSRIRSKTKEIASEFTGEYSYDVVDLTDLAKNMRSTFANEANQLEAALNNFVVYSSANETNANGVSIYYPYHAKEYSSYYIPMYSTFDFALEYTSFITSFSMLLTGEDTLTAEWNPETMLPTKNEDLTFSLELTPEQAANVQNVYYVISREDTTSPGNYVFVSMSNQVTLNASNTLTADFNGDIIYMQNDTTYDEYEVMYTVQEATDTYTRYLLSCILYNEDIEEEEAMYAYFVMETSDEHPEGQLLGAYPIVNYVNSDGEEIFPDRYEINIYDYNYIAFGVFSHEFTSSEDLTEFNESDWSDLVLQYNDFPISDGFSTVIGDMIPDVPYYGMFIIEDLQGNRHCSNLVQLQ